MTPTIDEMAERLRTHNEFGALLHVVQRRRMDDRWVAIEGLSPKATEEDRRLAADLLEMSLEDRLIAWDRAHRPDLIAETVNLLKLADAYGALHVVVEHGNLDDANIRACMSADDATAQDKALAQHLLSMTETDRCAAWNEAFEPGDA